MRSSIPEAISFFLFKQQDFPTSSTIKDSSNSNPFSLKFFHFLTMLEAKCLLMMKTFKSSAGLCSCDNWKFPFFNYTSERLEVIVTIQRNMFEIKCTDCGITAMVPFKPTVGKPAYCRACFSKHTYEPSKSVSKNNGFNTKQAWAQRRDIEQVKKQDRLPGLFRWSYPKQDKEPA